MRDSAHGFALNFSNANLLKFLVFEQPREVITSLANSGYAFVLNWFITHVCILDFHGERIYELNLQSQMSKAGIILKIPKSRVQHE